MLFNKAFDDIDYSDIQFLINNRVAEHKEKPGPSTVKVW